MKKRSLVSALAMLIVSAIVLTSATYAWFSSASSATVTSFQATVSNDDGSIAISADGGTTYVQTLDDAAILAAQANSIASVFTPHSLNTTNYGLVSGSVADGVFTSAAAIAGSYTRFTLKVRSAGDATVTVTPTWTPGASGFVYCLVREMSAEATPIILGTNPDSYRPVTNAGSCADTDGSGIISQTEAEAVGSTVTLADASVATTAATTITLAFAAGTANQVKDVEVICWAEGQDSNCTGAIAAATTTLGLNFTLA